MNVGFPEDFPNQPDFHSAYPEALSAMDGVVQSRQKFFTAVAYYYQRPINSYAKRIDQHSGEWGRSITTIVGTLAEHNSDTAPDITADLIISENYERVLALARITNDFQIFNPDESRLVRENLRESIVDENDQLVTGAALGIFEQHINIDIANLYEMVDSGKKAKVVEVARTVGKISLDIAKISTGVLLALGIYNRRNK